MTKHLEATPRRSLSKPQRNQRIILIALIGALVVVLTVLVVMLVSRFSNGGADQPAVAKTPAAAVEGYLNALAQADAAGALAFSAQQPDDELFLTDAVLRDLVAEHPLTDIAVTASATKQAPVVVAATYTLGSTPVQAQFTVTKVGQNWRLAGGFIKLDVASLVAFGVPLTLNGIDFQLRETLELFPGVYTLASASPMLSLDNASFTIDYPESNPVFDQMKFALSSDGVSKIREAAQVKLDWCLGQLSLQPEGCGFGFAGANEGEVDETTISWTLEDSSEPLSKLKPALDGPSKTVAIGFASVQVRLSALSNDRMLHYNDESSFSRLRADFSDPERIIVTFGN